MEAQQQGRDYLASSGDGLAIVRDTGSSKIDFSQEEGPMTALLRDAGATDAEAVAFLSTNGHRPWASPGT